MAMTREKYREALKSLRHGVDDFKCSGCAKVEEELWRVIEQGNRDAEEIARSVSMAMKERTRAEKIVGTVKAWLAARNPRLSFDPQAPGADVLEDEIRRLEPVDSEYIISDENERIVEALEALSREWIGADGAIYSAFGHKILETIRQEREA